MDSIFLIRIDPTKKYKSWIIYIGVKQQSRMDIILFVIDLAGVPLSSKRQTVINVCGH